MNLWQCQVVWLSFCSPLASGNPDGILPVEAAQPPGLSTGSPAEKGSWGTGTPRTATASAVPQKGYSGPVSNLNTFHLKVSLSSLLFSSLLFSSLLFSPWAEFQKEKYGSIFNFSNHQPGQRTIHWSSEARTSLLSISVKSAAAASLRRVLSRSKTWWKDSR